MRIALSFFFFAIGLVLGWFGGSAYPAPQAWLDQIGLAALVERVEADEAAPSGDASADERSTDQFLAWISEARRAHLYRESEERMYAVMQCESNGRPSVVNPAGPYSGLFQYSDRTWNGDWNTYRDQGILDARAQIFATALAWSIGMQSQWGCYAHTN